MRSSGAVGRARKRSLSWLSLVLVSATHAPSRLTPERSKPPGFLKRISRSYPGATLSVAAASTGPVPKW